MEETGSVKIALGRAAGERCGVVWGGRAPCDEVLRDEGGSARCPRHCRTRNRNPDARHELCPRPPLKGRTRCRTHGGMARVGPLSPSWKGGRFSRFLPDRYKGWLEASASGDPLDLSDDINVMGARAAELLSRLGDEPGPGFAAEVRKALSALERELEPVLTERTASMLGALRELVKGAVESHSAWAEALDVMARRTKAVESQRKRALESGRLVAVEEAMAMFKGFADALKKAASALPKEQADSLLTEVNRLWAAQQGVDDRARDDDPPM